MTQFSTLNAALVFCFGSLIFDPMFPVLAFTSTCAKIATYPGHKFFCIKFMAIVSQINFDLAYKFLYNGK